MVPSTHSNLNIQEIFFNAGDIELQRWQKIEHFQELQKCQFLPKFKLETPQQHPNPQISAENCCFNLWWKVPTL